MCVYREAGRVRGFFFFFFFLIYKACPWLGPNKIPSSMLDTLDDFKI